MSLEKYTEELYKFSRSDGDGNITCVVCDKSNLPLDELYFHIKMHLDQQYDDNSKSVLEKKSSSPCFICKQVIITNSIIEDQSIIAKDLINVHYKKHIQQLKGYMIKKVITVKYWGSPHL